MYLQLPSPEDNGWKQDNGGYCMDWDCPNLQKEVQETINFLVKGCSCKKGCKTKQCGCRKKGHHCGPGCECQSCTNLIPSATQTQERANAMAHIVENTLEQDTEFSDSEEEDEEEDEDGIQTEIITDTIEDFLDFIILPDIPQ